MNLNSEITPAVSPNWGPSAAKLIPASLDANPKAFGKNGRRTFYLDQDGILHQNWGPEPATANSPEIK